MNHNEITKLINAEHPDPFSLLGIHRADTGIKPSEASGTRDSLSVPNGNATEKTPSLFVIRSFFPGAKDISVITSDTASSYKMAKIHDAGLFEVIIEDRDDFFTYMLEVCDSQDGLFSIYDPYSFLPVLTDFDTYLFNKGDHHNAYEKLGAHITSISGISGVHFAVWAPCAKRVSVVGSFNQWDGRRYQMRRLGSSGVWEIFIPGLSQGDLYKYEIKTPSGEIYIKSDPYAFFSELRPETASIVYCMDNYTWNDQKWIADRDSSNIFERPVSIYELHLGSWVRKAEEENRFLTYRELADTLVNYVLDMGYTHIEILPIAEHPFDGSWGYQITGYYSVTSRYGSPEDFMYFVDVCHRNGIGVIMDWVPAHFPKDGHGLARFDGTAIYEHENPKQGEHLEWGTHIFNYGRPEVRNFLVSNAVFWFKKYHIDGLRVDAVASMIYLDFAKKKGEWIPNKWGGRENVEAIEFLRQLNTTVYKYFPGIMMIAEESTSWALVTKPPYLGGLGFSFKWNMGWMNDYLKYISMDSIFRKYHHNLITFSLMYAFSENFIIPLSHDEVVHGKCSMLNKMPGDYWQKFAGLRASYGFMFGHPGKKLLFMGNEFGHFIEWNYSQSLDWHLLNYDMHKKMQNFVRDLNRLYAGEKALHEVDFSQEGFEWIDCDDMVHGVVSFIRKGKDWHDMLIFVCNFTPVVHDHYRIGVPFDLFYTEILNSDSEIYGGSNVGNTGGMHSEQQACHGRPYSMGIRIPPLSVIVFKPVFEA